MAGGAQGGGGRPAQANPQGMQQFQNALQNYRQGSMGMPSQVPGANVAAPGGMAAPQPQMSQPLPPAQQQIMGNTMPMQVPQMSQPLPPAPQQTAQIDTTLQQMPPAQQQQMEALGAQIRAQGLMPQIMNPQQATEFFSNLRQNMGGNRPQIQGNPNAMPLQRPQRFNPGMMMGRGRNG